MTPAARALLHLMPETGCSAEWLRQNTGSTIEVIDQLLQQLVTAGQVRRRENRYLPFKPTESALATLAEPKGDPAMTDKTCVRCLEKKPLTEFGDDTRTSDGKARVCRSCRRPGGRKKTAVSGAAGKTAKVDRKARSRRGRPRTAAASSGTTLSEVVVKHTSPRRAVKPRLHRCTPVIPQIVSVLDTLRRQHTAIGRAIELLESV